MSEILQRLPEFLGNHLVLTLAFFGVVIALVCRNGQVSARAAQRLRKAGFGKVYWLEGGLAAWQQAQMPLVAGRA